eukprot:179265-Rhodomonas_salina.1
MVMLRCWSVVLCVSDVPALMFVRGAMHKSRPPARAGHVQRGDVGRGGHVLPADREVDAAETARRVLHARCLPISTSVMNARYVPESAINGGEGAVKGGATCCSVGA